MAHQEHACLSGITQAIITCDQNKLHTSTYISILAPTKIGIGWNCFGISKFLLSRVTIWDFIVLSVASSETHTCSCHTVVFSQRTQLHFHLLTWHEWLFFTILQRTFHHLGFCWNLQWVQRKTFCQIYLRSPTMACCCCYCRHHRCCSRQSCNDLHSSNQMDSRCICKHRQCSKSEPWKSLPQFTVVKTLISLTLNNMLDLFSFVPTYHSPNFHSLPTLTPNRVPRKMPWPMFASDGCSESDHNGPC